MAVIAIAIGFLLCRAIIEVGMESGGCDRCRAERVDALQEAHSV